MYFSEAEAEKLAASSSSNPVPFSRPNNNNNNNGRKRSYTASSVTKQPLQTAEPESVPHFDMEDWSKGVSVVLASAAGGGTGGANGGVGAGGGAAGGFSLQGATVGGSSGGGVLGGGAKKQTIQILKDGKPISSKFQFQVYFPKEVGKTDSAILKEETKAFFSWREDKTTANGRKEFAEQFPHLNTQNQLNPKMIAVGPKSEKAHEEFDKAVWSAVCKVPELGMKPDAKGRLGLLMCKLSNSADAKVPFYPVLMPGRLNSGWICYDISDSEAVKRLGCDLDDSADFHGLGFEQADQDNKQEEEEEQQSDDNKPDSPVSRMHHEQRKNHQRKGSSSSTVSSSNEEYDGENEGSDDNEDGESIKKESSYVGDACTDGTKKLKTSSTTSATIKQQVSDPPPHPQTIPSSRAYHI